MEFEFENCTIDVVKHENYSDLFKAILYTDKYYNNKIGNLVYFPKVLIFEIGTFLKLKLEEVASIVNESFIQIENHLQKYPELQLESGIISIYYNPNKIAESNYCHRTEFSVSEKHKRKEYLEF